MSEAIAAVVFDLDGVLINSESVWDAARREVVARNGGRWQAGATRAMMGMSSPERSWFLFDLNQIRSSRMQLSSTIFCRKYEAVVSRSQCAVDRGSAQFRPPAAR